MLAGPNTVPESWLTNRLLPGRQGPGDEQRVEGEGGADDDRHPRPTPRQHVRARDRAAATSTISHLAIGIGEGVDVAELLELGRFEQDDLSILVGQVDAVEDGESAVDEPLLDLVDHVRHVEHDLIALDGDRAGGVTVEDPHQCLLGSRVGGDPEVLEGVGGDEVRHLTLDQAVDRTRDGADQELPVAAGR